MSTHNICFYGEITFFWRNKQNYPLIIMKYPSYQLTRAFKPLVSL